MTKYESYRHRLAELSDREALKAYLLAESGLPGPRGNIELAQAVAAAGDEALFDDLLTYNPERAPVNTPEEFLHFCGTLGLGTLLAQGRTAALEALRRLAADPRWRTREAVAIALQLYGDTHFEALILEMGAWAQGSPYEQRAAAAALCEPRLLKDAHRAAAVLNLLDRITEAMAQSRDRKSDSFAALRKGMAYCWSVAAVADPETGQRLMEKWAASTDHDILWLLKENLKKKRTERMDSGWTAQMKRRLGLRAR